MSNVKKLLTKIMPRDILMLPEVVRPEVVRIGKAHF